MTAATKLITPAIRQRAERLAEDVPSWLRATSRVNGRSFLIAPSSDGRAAHYVSFAGCTCRGFLNRGVCAHNEAVKLVERRRMAEMAAEQPASVAVLEAERQQRAATTWRYCVRKCGTMLAPEHVGKFCSPCWEKARRLLDSMGED